MDYFGKKPAKNTNSAEKACKKGFWHGFNIFNKLVRSIKKFRNLLRIFLLKPLYYGFYAYFSRRKEIGGMEKRSLRQKKKDPSYSGKLPKIMARYQRRLKYRQREKQKSLDLNSSYSALGYAILILAMVWTMTNSYIIYRNFFHNVKAKIENQAGVVELVSTNMMSAVDNYLNYVGDRVLVFDAKNNLVNMKNILKKTPNRDIYQKNISSWLRMSFVNTDGDVAVTTADGVLKERLKPEAFYPVTPAVKDPWRFKIGSIQHFENELT